MMKLLTKRQRNKLIGLGISLIIAGMGWLIAQQQAPKGVLGTNIPGTYRVLSVADGDTITVDMNGAVEKIRLIGVDTPETHDPRKEVQCFGQAASEFTKQLVSNQNVRLESDSLSSNRDRYDRLLRYVYLPDGRLLQAEIIKHGYGFAYTSFPFTKLAEFKQLENDARTGVKGLWGNCQIQSNERGIPSTNTAQ
jgi:micrococcal nuclease